MPNRSILYTLPLALMLLLGGCGDDDARTPGTTLSGALITDPERPVIDDGALVRSNAQLNAGIFQALSKAGENLFYSPFSVFSALSMTYAGAQGTTKGEFEQVLHYDDNLSVHESFALLLERNVPQHNIYRIANSLWPQEGYPFKEDFIYTVVKGYASEVNFEDYMNDYESARLEINAWVEEKTEEKIVDLIPENALDEMTRLVLVNALYFKGTWAYEFDQNKTDEQPFYLSGGGEKSCDMMHIEGEFGYRDFGEYKALKLPYKEHEFSMVLFLPSEGAAMDTLVSDLFEDPDALLSQLRSTEVKVSLPKFTVKWGTESLKPFLIDAGMVTAFDGELADFTGMWQRQNDENLYITDVLHQAFIEVNEEGAEAAAATAVIVGETSAMPNGPEIFNADRPFLFLILDESNGMTVFTGKIEDPTL